MNRHYLVSWKIDVFADNPGDAANKALKIQRDPNSIATIFDVSEYDGKSTQVDLYKLSLREEDTI